MNKKIIRGIFLKAAYPLYYIAARAVGVKSDRLQIQMVKTNNSLVRWEFKARATKLLLLLPQCIQRDECRIKVTSNIFNCARCGKCEIKDLIDIADEFNMKLYVATGGTLARRVVVETKPEAIIAVACERDLSSGIADSYPMPVLGVINDRPHGPCVNTSVDLKQVRQALLFFSGNEPQSR